jgi:DNA-binding transcriptional regulator PaaX
MKDGDLIIGIMASMDRGEYAVQALLALTRPFGVSPASLRTALSRFLKKGVLEVSRKDGKPAYSFSGKGRRITGNVAAAFAAPDRSPWDGTFWGLAFSLPAESKNARYALTKKLSLYRFASLYPGFWIRPLREAERLDEKLKTIFADPGCRAIRFRPLKALGKAEAARLWDLDGAAAAMREAISASSAALKRSGGLDPEEAFIQKITIGERIVAALFRDPLLPRVFLPPDWPAPELRRLFTRFDAVMTARSRPFRKGILGEDPA